VAVSHCKIRTPSSNGQVGFLRPDQKDGFYDGKPVAVTPSKRELSFHTGLDMDWSEPQLSFEVEKCGDETGGER